MSIFLFCVFLLLFRSGRKCYYCGRSEKVLLSGRRLADSGLKICIPHSVANNYFFNVLIIAIFDP